MDTWTAIERLGLPTVLLVVFSFAVWRGLKWFGVNIATPIAKSHIALVDEVKIASERNSETLQKVTEIIQVKAVALVQLAKQNEEVVKLTKEANIKLDGIVNAFPIQTKVLVDHLTTIAAGMSNEQLVLHPPHDV